MFHYKNTLFESDVLSDCKFHASFQEIVRQEILTVYPEEGQIDGADLPHLMAAICETQRIRSIVPVGIPHGCLEVRPTAVNNSFRRVSF